MKKSLIQTFSSHYFRVGIGLFVSGFALFLVTRQVDLSETWEVIKRARLGFIGMGIGSVCLNNLGKTVRWRALLGKSGHNIKFTTLLKAMLVGQLMNLATPGRVGDFARVMMLGRYTSKAFVVGTIAIEKIIETLAFVFLFFISILLIPLPDWAESSSLTMFGIAVIGSITLVGGIYFHEQFLNLLIRITRLFPVRFQKGIALRLELAFASLKELNEINALFSVAFLTFIVWGTAILNNYAGMLALGIQLPMSASVILLIGLQVGIVASVSPGAIGIFETICILTLVYFGVERSLALGYGLLLHALVFGPQVVGGIWSLIGWESALPINRTEG